MSLYDFIKERMNKSAFHIGRALDRIAALRQHVASDAGNIFQVIPTIERMTGISDVPAAGHSEAFKAAACFHPQ